MSESASHSVADDNVQTCAPRAGRRWYQFGFRTMLAVMTVVSVAVGTIGMRLNRAKSQRQAITMVMEIGGSVQVDADSSWLDQNLERVLGGETFDFRTISTVGLSRKELTDEQFRALGTLTSLRDLGLDHTNLNDETFAYLSGLHRIEYLMVNGTAISRLDPIRRFRRLETLWIDKTNIDDDGLLPIHDKSELEELSISYTKVTDHGLAHLKGLESIQDLNLTGLNITDDGLVNLTRMNKLLRLELAHTPIDGTGLEHVTSTNLVYLGAGDTMFSDEAAIHLSRFTELHVLGLTGTPITDAGLTHLAGLRRITYLELEGTQVRGSGLRHLREMRLDKLLLYDTPLQDEGLQHLEQILWLKNLYLWKTNCTPEAITRLQLARPKLSITE